MLRLGNRQDRLKDVVNVRVNGIEDGCGDAYTHTSYCAAMENVEAVLDGNVSHNWELWRWTVVKTYGVLFLDIEFKLDAPGDSMGHSQLTFSSARWFT